MKDNIIRFLTGIGAGITTTLLGGWDKALEILLIFIVIDYITGVAAAIKITRDDLDPAALRRAACRAGSASVSRRMLALDEARLALASNVAPLVAMEALTVKLSGKV